MTFLWRLIQKGGKGSGNFGHAGRPGKVGGSAPQGSFLPPPPSSPPDGGDLPFPKIIEFMEADEIFSLK